jgi:hypothetical protein
MSPFSFSRISVIDNQGIGARFRRGSLRNGYHIQVDVIDNLYILTRQHMYAHIV